MNKIGIAAAFCGGLAIAGVAHAANGDRHNNQVIADTGSQWGSEECPWFSVIDPKSATGYQTYIIPSVIQEVQIGFQFPPPPPTIRIPNPAGANDFAVFMAAAANRVPVDFFEGPLATDCAGNQVDQAHFPTAYAPGMHPRLVK